jgi:hypothetical protein
MLPRSLCLIAIIVLVLGITVQIIVFTKANETTSAFPKLRDRPLISRFAGNHIRKRAAGGHHMIVCGPTGVGKTMAAKQAFDNNETINGIDTPTTFLPFYVDLKSFVVPASHEQAARVITERMNDDQATNMPPTASRATHVDAAFAEAADSFENRIVKLMQADAIGMLYELSWQFLRKLELMLPNAAIYIANNPVTVPSVARHLQRFMDAAASFQTFLRLFSFIYGPRGCIPVLIVDEVHLLNDPDFLAIRHEFVAFLFKHASAKSMAPVVLVLLSSDATAPVILKSCAYFLFMHALLLL